MNEGYPAVAVMNIVNEILTNQLVFAREIGIAAKVDVEHFDVYQKVEEQLNAVKKKVEGNGLSTNYANQLVSALDKLKLAFATGYSSGDIERRPISFATEEERSIFKKQQERRGPEISRALHALSISADFFIKLDFFNRDVVVVGANGSGKTSLAVQLAGHINKNGVLIAASKVLALKHMDSIRRIGVTSENLRSIQIKTDRFVNIDKNATEFEVLIEHLVADDAMRLRQNRDRSKPDVDPLPPPTKLQILLMMWNRLFPHLEISLSDDINIQAKRGLQMFHSGSMSEGEKVAMFLIAHVLLCPENGFVIVDEPEMYLHPAVYKKLWDLLEQERNDCNFIYLTHNLDFASSRISAKKLWLRSFEYPETFGFEEIPDSEIPEPLMMELLGSRQTILFCEGVPGGLDENIYRILYPKFTIKPVNGCLNVINFTKAFNKLGSTMSTAIGIIDSDFHSQGRLEVLQKEKIFNIRLPEIENILFDSEVLGEVCKTLGKYEQIPKIKAAILKQLAQEKEYQVSSYITAKIDNLFKDSNVRRGNKIEHVERNFNEFVNQVNILRWAEEQRLRIDEIVKSRNYEDAIKVFNFKGLESIGNTFLKIRNYNLLAIEAIQKNAILKEKLMKYFPDIPKTT